MSEKLSKVKRWTSPAFAAALGMASVGGAAVEQKTTYKVGYDVSYPQAGKTLPKNRNFGIVGVNGGYANNFNSAIVPEFKWAQGSSGGTKQPKAQLYIWAASPGVKYWRTGQPTADWPKTGTNKFGTCYHNDSLACDFQYGFNKASADIAHAKKELKITKFGNVYIDVEADDSATSTGTWQPNSANNMATIEGFAQAVTDEGDHPSIYSDSYQYGYTVGKAGLDYKPSENWPEWETGGGTVKGAIEDCATPFIKGGHVAISQYVQGPPPSTANSPFDLDYAC